MYGLSCNYVIPFLLDKGVKIKNSDIIEIGCAEGGNLCAMFEYGAGRLVGTDIAEDRLEYARELSNTCGIKTIEYTNHDVITNEPTEEWIGKFDIALLRDVIEHLDDEKQALVNIKKMLKPGGILYVTFPPYYSPFGGHQQLLLNKISKIPFVHLLPKFIFNKLIKDGRAADVIEVQRIKEIRMTTSKFRKASLDSGYRILDEKLFFLRPVFKMKFGLPALSANILKPFPFIRDVFAMEAGYLLVND
jgi:2-polyprenyl-3-methyl-5-hydroxy-6-metoxy-1,4-benzoquinol methylase